MSLTVKQLILSFFCLALGFAYGAAVGEYKLPPYFQIRSFILRYITQEYDSYNHIDKKYYETDINDLITLKSEEDIAQKRESLLLHLWKSTSLPECSDCVNGTEEKDPRYQDIKSLEKIERLTISMDFGLESIAYYLHPKKSLEKLIILHEGHGTDFIRSKDAIRFFLDKGYHVLAFASLLDGMNNRPWAKVPRFGTMKIEAHTEIQYLDNGRGSPMRFFFEPIAFSLNYVLQQRQFDLIAMTGVSGGGWATSVYPALDKRIQRSYPVAGSWPLFMLESREQADYELGNRDFYTIATYPELYLMASFGKERGQLQIFNEYDSCCYAGKKFTLYEAPIKKKLESLGAGKFSVILDSTHRDHIISPFALKKIAEDLQTQ